MLDVVVVDHMWYLKSKVIGNVLSNLCPLGVKNHRQTRWRSGLTLIRPSSGCLWFSHWCLEEAFSPRQLSGDFKQIWLSGVRPAAVSSFASQQERKPHFASWLLQVSCLTTHGWDFRQIIRMNPGKSSFFIAMEKKRILCVHICTDNNKRVIIPTVQRTINIQVMNLETHRLRK